jgi:GT2 family glycosyltransferase
MEVNSQIGIVVIGRNEGERLRNCLQSISRQSQRIAYVDSGSTDGSVTLAEEFKATVVQLDMSTPFSAARARNAGFSALLERFPFLEFIQFVDGDCELQSNWLAFARNTLEQNNNWAVVAGRRRERYPKKSIYNQLCDIEWDTPVGEAKSCGGDFMIRTEAFRQVEGFNPTVVAGEEPEMCFRLRQKGWKIYRLDHEMTMHDANITKFSQWWKRAVRSGHAYAQGYALHRNSKEPFCAAETQKIWLWSAIIPLLILISAITINKAMLYVFGIYIIQFLKITTNTTKKGRSIKKSTTYSLFVIAGKFPQLFGQWIYLSKHFTKSDHKIIEYK